ncbi:hypothetical protein Tco_1255872 [Tanacetum coccineum]
MALPEDHLAKFYKMTDAKEMWDAIKSRFGGNDESKKMQKYILKQQFEGFSVSNTEGLHKGYDRFQSLLSQLEIHGAGVSTEDANKKFLRSLPSAWSQVSLIMRTKPGVDTLSFDDLYNNLRVFESDIKGSTSVFMNKESDLENQPLNDRFAKGMHAVPPPMTGNYMPTGPEIEIDYSQFTYGPKQTQPSESESQSSECLVNAPIIEEYESDSDDECVVIPTKQQETPSFANQQVKTPMENVKSQNTHCQKPKVNKKELGHGKIKTGKLDFEDVCFVKELQHFTLFSVSQMCDKKNKVLFTDSECLVLVSEFKLTDEKSSMGFVST